MPLVFARVEKLLRHGTEGPILVRKCVGARDPLDEKFDIRVRIVQPLCRQASPGLGEHQPE